MAKVDPECINASNPFHECSDYCYNKIAEHKQKVASQTLENDKELEKKLQERTVHPDCINASNRYHECSEYCFRKIVETKAKLESGNESADDAPSSFNASEQAQVHPEDNASDGNEKAQGNAEEGYPHLNERQKKLFELRLKMNEARKANQAAMVAEKKKSEDPGELRGISKQKWMEERKKKIGKLLDSNGLDMTKAYMLDTQETAEAKYKKWEKDHAPSGWDG